MNRSRSIPQFSAADFDRHRPPKPASVGLGPRSISPRTNSPQRPGRRRRDVRCSVVARTSPQLVSKFVRFSFRRASQSMALLACWALGARSVLAASIWMCLEALARGMINCHPVSATAVVYEPRARRARPGQEDQTIVLCGSLNKFGGGLKISPRSLHLIDQLVDRTCVCKCPSIDRVHRAHMPLSPTRSIDAAQSYHPLRLSRS